MVFLEDIFINKIQKSTIEKLVDYTCKIDSAFTSNIKLYRINKSWEKTFIVKLTRDV